MTPPKLDFGLAWEAFLAESIFDVPGIIFRLRDRVLPQVVLLTSYFPFASSFAMDDGQQEPTK